MSPGLLDFLPLWGVFAVTFFLVLLSIEIGYRSGQYRNRKSSNEKDGPVGSISAATLGLLAFMLAFTFGLAAARFDDRRHMVVDDANAIGTTFLRAGMLPEHSTEIRALLREYADVRLEAARNADLQHGKLVSEALQTKLWAHATDVAVKHPDSHIVSLFVQSLNDMIDIHSKRIAAVRSRIPTTIWFALYTISVISFATIGYHSGLSKSTRSIAILAIALSFSGVMWLIVNLDRPQEGSLKIGQQAMVDLVESMKDTTSTQPKSSP